MIFIFSIKPLNINIPEEARKRDSDDGHDESVHPAQGVGHPAEQIRAKQHPEHVESAVDRSGAAAVTDQTKVLDQAGGDETVVIDQLLGGTGHT